MAVGQARFEAYSFKRLTSFWVFVEVTCVDPPQIYMNSKTLESRNSHHFTPLNCALMYCMVFRNK